MAMRGGSSSSVHICICACMRALCLQYLSPVMQSRLKAEVAQRKGQVGACVWQDPHCGPQAQGPQLK